MEIIGALSMAGSKSTIYFLAAGNQPKSIVNFLSTSENELIREISGKKMRIAAVESCDELKKDKHVVGAFLYDGSCMVKKNYENIKPYFLILGVNRI